MRRSRTKSPALTTNADDTSRPEARLRSALELRPTSTSETADVTMMTHGKEVTSMLARNRASRAALPAMNCAVTTLAQTIAVATGETALAVDEVISLYLDPMPRRILAGASTRPVATRCCRDGNTPRRVGSIGENRGDRH